MKTLQLLPIFAMAIFLFLNFNQAHAIQSAFLQIDKNVYLKGDIILLYGSIGNYAQGSNVTAKIFDNKGNLLLTQTTIPKQDLTFLLRIPTNDTNWKTGGPYDVQVWYGTCCHIGDSTFTFYSDKLPPLKQSEEGIPFWDMTCNSGLTMIMKQEDGAVACVKPDSLQRLVALNWGYDPSEKITTYGLKDIYQAGEEIDFKFRVNGFGNICDQPTVTVTNSDQKIIWQSSQYATGCATGLVNGQMEDEAYLGRESHLGYDYNNYGPLTINQAGTYFLNISWLDGNLTKQFTVIEQPSETTIQKPDCVYSCTTWVAEPNVIKIKSVGVSPYPLQVGDIARFNVTYQKIGDAPLYHIIGCGSDLSGTFSPPSSVQELRDERMCAEGIQAIEQNQTITDWTSSRYSILKPGLLNVTLNLYLSKQGFSTFGDKPEATIQFSVNVIGNESSVTNQTGQQEFDGAIVDQSLDARHLYSLYTNDTSTYFDIGSNGIWLDGLDNIDGLDGKHVKIFGTKIQVLHGEDKIKVDNFQIIGSYIPPANPTGNITLQVTLGQLYSNPDKYYNQTVTIMGQLREYDYPLAYAGVGCILSQYTTNETFVPDFASRHQLYDGQDYVGVRIGGAGDVGYSPTERLPADLKNQSVYVTGIFVPEIHDTGMCMHVLHKSGYILTDFSKIRPIGE